MNGQEVRNEPRRNKFGIRNKIKVKDDVNSVGCDQGQFVLEKNSAL